MRSNCRLRNVISGREFWFGASPQLYRTVAGVAVDVEQPLDLREGVEQPDDVAGLGLRGPPGPVVGVLCRVGAAHRRDVEHGRVEPTRDVPEEVEVAVDVGADFARVRNGPA